MRQLNRFLKSIVLTSLILGTGLASQSVNASPTFHEMKSSDYVRVTIPAASIESAKLVYTTEGNSVEAKLSHGEKVTLHGEANNILAKLYFYAQEETEGNFLFKMTGTDPQGSDYFVQPKSSSEESPLDGEEPIYIQAVGAKVELVPSGNLDDIVHSLPNPILLGSEAMHLSKVGMLEIRIVVLENEPAEGNDTNPQENDEGGLPEGQAATGGCSLGSNIPGIPGVNAALVGLVVALGLATRQLKARRR